MPTKAALIRCATVAGLVRFRSPARGGPRASSTSPCRRQTAAWTNGSAARTEPTASADSTVSSREPIRMAGTAYDSTNVRATNGQSCAAVASARPAWRLPRAEVPVRSAAPGLRGDCPPARGPARRGPRPGAAGGTGTSRRSEAPRTPRSPRQGPGRRRSSRRGPPSRAPGSPRRPCWSARSGREPDPGPWPTPRRRGSRRRLGPRRSIAASVVGASFSARAARRTPHGQPCECRWTTLAVRSVASTSCRASTSVTSGTSIASSEPATLVSWPATWCRWISIAGSPWLRRTRRSPRIAWSRTTSRSRPSCPICPDGKSSSTTTHGPLRRRNAPNTVSACRLRRSWEPTSGIGMTCRSPASTRASRRSVQKRSGSAPGPATFSQISPPGSSDVVAHSATAWVLPHPVGAVTNVSRPDTPRSSSVGNTWPRDHPGRHVR